MQQKTNCFFLAGKYSVMFDLWCVGRCMKCSMNILNKEICHIYKAVLKFEIPQNSGQ